VASKEEANAVANRIMEELPHLKAIPPEESISDIEQGMVIFNLM